jgi:fructuronate reductase
MENTLLQANATLPQYDRDSLQPRIVHLGFGAFHRAHQAVYADILAAGTAATGATVRLT